MLETLLITNFSCIHSSARIKSYARNDSVGSGCAIEEISSVRHLDGKTYDNNHEEIGTAATSGRTARRSVLEGKVGISFPEERSGRTT